MMSYFGYLSKEIPPLIENLKSFDHPGLTGENGFINQYTKIKEDIESARKEALAGKGHLFHRYAMFPSVYHSKRENSENTIKNRIEELSNLHKYLVQECQIPETKEIHSVRSYSRYERKEQPGLPPYQDESQIRTDQCQVKDQSRLISRMG